jgi:hypothetical protein
VNLFQVRKKVIKLVLKLIDLGVLQAVPLLPYLLQKIKLHLESNVDDSRLKQICNTVHVQLLLELIRQSQNIRGNVIVRLN